MIQIMMFQGNGFQASIGEAINPGAIMVEAITPNLMVGKAINRGSILEQSNKSKSYSGKAIDLKCIYCVRTKYCSLPNKRLKLTAPSVHAFCYSAGVDDPGPRVNKRAPRPAA